MARDLIGEVSKSLTVLNQNNTVNVLNPNPNVLSCCQMPNHYSVFLESHPGLTVFYQRQLKSNWFMSRKDELVPFVVYMNDDHIFLYL